MDNKLHPTVAGWLLRAYELAEHHKNHEVSKFHVAYAMFSDSYFDKFWKHNSGKDSALKIIGKQIGDMESDVVPTKPQLSPLMRKWINFSIALQPSAPLQPETLAFTMMNVDECQSFKNGPYGELQTHTKALIETIANKAAIDFLNREAIEKAKDPAAKVTLESLQDKILFLRQDLGEKIFDQEEAIDLVCNTISMAAAGIKRENKTSGSFLFRGPTGAGKTELAKQVSKLLGIPLHRFDMSEYMEKHTVSKLIGAPPGYVGYNEAALLTKSVDKDPCCVVLLDEVEKAHPDLFNLLLQVMDDGKLTSGSGRAVDFSNVILIMTSNIGEKSEAKYSVGFGGSSDEKDTKAEAVNEFFSPEFRNRLDGIAKFNKTNAVPRLVEKFQNTFIEEMEAKSIRVEFTQAATNRLVELSKNTEFGPRSISRIFEQKIKTDVAMAILTKKLQPGMDLIIDFEAAQKAFVIKPEDRNSVTNIIATHFGSPDRPGMSMAA